MGTERRSGLQSQRSCAAWRRPGCRCWVAKEGHLAMWGSWMRGSACRGGVEGSDQLHWWVSGSGSAPSPLCKRGLEGDARPAREMETGCWFTRRSRGERDLREEAAEESGSAPASCGALDPDSESSATRPEPLGCVLWSAAYRLPASPRRQQSVSQTPWDWTVYTTSGLETD